MCGFCALISDPGHSNLPDFIRKMAAPLAHRGPDDEGYYVSRDHSAAYAHKRLSIIDLNPRSAQPMFSKSGRTVIVFNGEIYNYKELAQKYLKDVRLKTSGDTEVILELYEQYGMEVLNLFNGMFAFFLTDTSKGVSYLVRDFTGIKPCYYVQNGSFFGVSSEAKSFLNVPEIYRPVINEDVLDRLILFQYNDKNRESLYKGIRRLEAGHYLEYHHVDRHLKTVKYWDLRHRSDYAAMSFEEAVCAGEKLLVDSVKRRLTADVPVGTLLSGGLDSSLIAAIAKEHSGGDVNTFSATFHHPLDETRYSTAVADHIGSVHHKIPVYADDIVNHIEDMITSFDDFSSVDGGMFMISIITKIIKETYDFKVLLVGEGADEIMGGYSWFNLSRFPLNLMPRLFRTFFHSYAVSRIFSQKGHWRHVFEMDRIIKQSGYKNIFNQAAFWETKYQLPNNYLMKVDHGSMAHSIEARVPFLDKELVEFAFSIPDRYKLKGRIVSPKASNEKYILREVARKYLPSEIFQRKKRGFSVTMEQILKANREKMKDYFFREGSLVSSRFKKKEIVSLMNFKESMYSPFDKQKEFLLWKLFLLEIWYQRVFKG